MIAPTRPDLSFRKGGVLRITASKVQNMMIRSQKDFVAGLLFLVVGLGFAYASAHYRLGTPARMGPGFFPLVLASLLALFGGGVMIGAIGRSDSDSGRLRGFNFRSLIAIVLATVVFAWMIRPAGVLVTVAVVAFIASFAATNVRLRVAFANVAIQMVIAYAVFHYLLGLQIPVLPTFFQ